MLVVDVEKVPVTWDVREIQRRLERGCTSLAHKVLETFVDYDEQKRQLEQKRQSLSLSADLLVAGEFLRRGWPASLVYSPQGRLVIRLNDKAVQVRFARDDEFDIQRLSQPVTIFVNLPRSSSAPPEYFILTSGDIKEATKSRYWRGGFGSKTDRPLLPPPKMLLVEAHHYKDKWDKIAQEFGVDRVDWNNPRPGKPDPFDSE